MSGPLGGRPPKSAPYANGPRSGISKMADQSSFFLNGAARSHRCARQTHDRMASTQRPNSCGVVNLLIVQCFTELELPKNANVRRPAAVSACDARRLPGRRIWR